MKIAVKDANILIDLVNGGMFELALRLPYSFVTTQTVLMQLEVESQWKIVKPFVESGVLTIEGLSSQEMAQVLENPLKSTLGVADLEVLLVAKRVGGILLTGDLELREISRKQKVEVHGLLWLMDKMIEEKLIADSLAAKNLRLVLAQGAFLPKAECEERLKKWEKR